MGRPRTADQTTKVGVTLTRQAVARLDELANLGVYGNTAAEVARYLIIREIDDLMRADALPFRPVDRRND